MLTGNLQERTPSALLTRFIALPHSVALRLILAISIVMLLMAANAAAETFVFGCKSAGLKYAGSDAVDGPRSGVVSPVSTAVDPYRNTALPPAATGGLTTEGKVPTPEDQRQNTAVTYDRFGGATGHDELTITVETPEGPKTFRGLMIDDPEDPAGKPCSQSNFTFAGFSGEPQCGDGSGGMGFQDKTCTAPATCQACRCVDSQTPVITTTTTQGMPPGRELLEQPHPEDDFVPRYRVDLDAVTAELPASLHLQRAFRQGTWYRLMDDFGNPLAPGYFVNVSDTSPGEELQIYVTGERLTFALNPSAGKLFLARKEDAFGNQRLYVRDTLGRVQQFRVRSGKEWVVVDYTSLSSTSDDYRTTESRCDETLTQCTSTGSTYEYRFKSNGLLGTVTELSPPHYLEEPSVTGQVHDISQLLQDPITTEYFYDSADRLTKITRNRGAQSINIAEYSYYASGPSAGRLHHATDVFGNTDSFSYQGDTVTRTSPFGVVTEATFDVFGGLVRQALAFPSGQTTFPQIEERYEYARPGRCDTMLTKKIGDFGDGPVELLRATWDSDLFRLLRYSIPGPNQNWLTETYTKFVHPFDGNFPQEILDSETGLTTVSAEFAPLADPTDSRFRLTSLSVLRPPIENQEGETYSKSFLTELNALGQIALEQEEDGVSTQYRYGTDGLLSRVMSTAPGRDPAADSSFTIALERDPITRLVTKRTEGDPRRPQTTELRYDGFALKEISSSGKSKTQVFRDRWGKTAVIRTYARDPKGGKFGGTGRDWWDTHFNKDQAALRVMTVMQDIADPRSPTPTFWTTGHTYDSHGRLASTQPPFGSKHSFGYSYAGLGIRKEMWRGEPQTGVLLKSLEWNPLTKRIQSLSSEVNGELRYENETTVYSPLGYPQEISSTFGSRVEYSYDNQGRVRRLQGFNGLTPVLWLENEYDNWNRRIQVELHHPQTGALELSESLLYHGKELKAYTDFLGRTTSLSYDAFGAVTGVTTPTANFEYSYDQSRALVGEVMEAEHGLRQAYQYERDQSGRIVSALHPNKERYSNSYDSVGRSAPQMSDSERYFGPDGRPYKLRWQGELDTEFQYDVTPDALVITAKIKGEGEKQYFLGEHGLNKIIFPDGSRLTYLHDRAGRVSEVKTRAGTRVLVSYDTQGRMIGRSVSGAQVNEEWKYEFDELQNLVKVIAKRNGELSERSFEYNTRGDLKKYDALEPGMDGLSAEYTYEHAGVGYISGFPKTAVIGGTLFENEYDYSSGRIVSQSVTPLNTPEQVFHFGDFVGEEPRSLTYPDGVLIAKWDRDAQGNLRTISHSTGNQEIAQTEVLVRDSSGRPVAVDTSLKGIWNKSLVIDYMGSRLSAVNDSTLGLSKRIFDVKNPFLLSESQGTVNTQKFSSDSLGRYSNINTLPIEYDHLGRLVRITDDAGTREFVYEGDNPKPVQVLDGTGNMLLELGYDLFNKLYRIKTSGGAWQYLLKRGDRVIGEYEPTTGVLKNVNVYFPKKGAPELLATIGAGTNGKSEYFTHAGIFSPLARFDDRGKLVAAYELDPLSGAVQARDSQGGALASKDLQAALHGHHFIPEALMADTMLRTLIFVRLGGLTIPLTWASRDPMSESNPGQPYSFGRDVVNLSDMFGGQEQRRSFNDHGSGGKACSDCHNSEGDNDRLVQLSKQVTFGGEELTSALLEMQKYPSIALLYSSSGEPLNPYYADTSYGAKTCMVCHAYSCFPFYRDIFPTLTAWGDFGIMIGLGASGAGAGIAGVGALLTTVTGSGSGFVISCGREGLGKAAEGAAIDAVISTVTWGLGKGFSRAVETLRRGANPAVAAETGIGKVLAGETGEAASETGKKCGKSCSGEDLAEDFQQMFRQHDAMEEYERGVAKRFEAFFENAAGTEVPRNVVSEAVAELGELNIRIDILHRGWQKKPSGVTVNSGIDMGDAYADITTSNGLTFTLTKSEDCKGLDIIVKSGTLPNGDARFVDTDDLKFILRSRDGQIIHSINRGAVLSFPDVDPSKAYILEMGGF